jgi:hypothetical protein
VSRLMCESCGLVYSQAAIAREMVLTTGAACRRCGGTLKAEVTQTRQGRREPVQAVRAGAYGLERMPSGRRSVDDDRGARPPARGRPR